MTQEVNVAAYGIEGAALLDIAIWELGYNEDSGGRPLYCVPVTECYLIHVPNGDCYNASVERQVL